MAMSFRTIATTTTTKTTTTTSSHSRSFLRHHHLRLNQTDSRRFLGNRSLWYGNATSPQRVHIGSKILLMVVNSVDPGSSPLPNSDPSGGSSWKIWLLGVVLSLIIPFTKNKWYPLLKLKQQVETALEAGEEAAELIVKVSKPVEEIADEIGHHLPEGKARHAAELVEELADKTGKAAAMADDIIEKAEEVEREVDSLIEIENEQKKEDKIKQVNSKQDDGIKNEAVAN